MRETCIADEEIRKANKIMTQNLKKEHLKLESTIKIDFIDIFCKSMRGLTIFFYFLFLKIYCTENQ